MAADPRVADHLSACLLLVGGRPIAFSFDLDVGTTRYGLCSGFDPAFAQASPGRLLHYRNTEAAIARGIRLINWGCGDSGYKRQLGAVEGPRLLDCLLVRDLPGLVSIVQRFWRRT
jgi:CelD/BcsL family acetyltransferase involved in cellulose biosynthesis